MHTLTNGSAKKLVDKNSKEIPLTKFFWSVADFTIKNAGPKVFEFQSPLNSAVSDKSFLEMLNPFEHVYYTSGSLAPIIKNQNNKKIYLLEKTEEYNKLCGKEKFRKVEKIPPINSENSLYIIGRFSRALHKGYTNIHIRGMAKIKDVIDKSCNETAFFVSPDVLTGPLEHISRSKFLQRYLLADHPLNPDFILILNKRKMNKIFEEYDIKIILEKLKILSEEDLFVIKEQYTSRGERNYYIKASDLIGFLNSENFLSLYTDSLILIEKFENEKTPDHQGFVYKTIRGAFRYFDGQFYSSIEYEDIHLGYDSHSFLSNIWNKGQEKLNDTTTKLFETAIKKFISIDFHSLISDLIKSSNYVEIILGLELIRVNYGFLYFKYCFDFTDINGDANNSFSIEISEDILNRIFELCQDENILIQQYSKDIIKKFQEHMKFKYNDIPLYTNITSANIKKLLGMEEKDYLPEPISLSLQPYNFNPKFFGASNESKQNDKTIYDKRFTQITNHPGLIYTAESYIEISDETLKELGINPHSCSRLYGPDETGNHMHYIYVYDSPEEKKRQNDPNPCKFQ